MKKLLSLLSVLTISGTAAPTVIAASLYEKQEKVNQLENSKSNLEVNNLENLKRNKRQNNNKFKIKNNLYYINCNEDYVNKEINVPYFITTMYTFTKDEYARRKGDLFLYWYDKRVLFTWNWTINSIKNYWYWWRSKNN